MQVESKFKQSKRGKFVRKSIVHILKRMGGVGMGCICPYDAVVGFLCYWHIEQPRTNRETAEPTIGHQARYGSRYWVQRAPGCALELQ